MRKVDLYWDMYMSFEALEEHIADGVFTNDNGVLEYLKVDVCTDVLASVKEYIESGAPEWATGVVWHRL